MNRRGEVLGVCCAVLSLSRGFSLFLCFSSPPLSLSLSLPLRVLTYEHRYTRYYRTCTEPVRTIPGMNKLRPQVRRASFSQLYLLVPVRLPSATHGAHGRRDVLLRNPSRIARASCFSLNRQTSTETRVIPKEIVVT